METKGASQMSSMETTKRVLMTMTVVQTAGVEQGTVTTTIKIRTNAKHLLTSEPKDSQFTPAMKGWNCLFHMVVAIILEVICATETHASTKFATKVICADFFMSDANR